MRIHQVTVRDVKGVQQCTLDFPDHGVVVVEGPNEVGKSTVLEAFDKLLDPRLKSTSVREEVRALAPVGRDVGPYVEAEFTVGGTRVRYAKRWLRQPMTTLEVLSPVPEQLTGEAAQARVDALIAQSLDRTLWDALRFTQSQDGTLAPLVDSAVLSSALDAAAGSALHVEDGDLILDRVAKEFALYFTRTGRPTGDYRAAINAYTEQQDAVSEAHRRLQEAELLLARQGQAREAVAVAAATRESARANLAQAQEVQAEVAAVTSAHDQVRARLGEASEKSRAAARARQQRRALVAELQSVTARVSRSHAELVTEQEAIAAQQEPLTAAEEAAAAADETVERAEEAWQAAQADADHCADRSRLAALESLAESVEELTGRLAASRARLPEHALTPQTLEEVKGLHQQTLLLQARHEGASGRLRVESLGAAVDVSTVHADDRSTDPQGTRVDPGGVQTIVVGEETVVTVEGAVRVVVVPEQGSTQRTAELAAARLDLDRALARHDVQGIEELELRVAEQEGVRQEVRDLARELEITLASRPGAEQREAAAGLLPSGLVAEVTALRARLEAYAAAREGQQSLPEDRAGVEAVVESAVQHLQEARAARRVHAEAVKDHRGRAQRLRTSLERATGRLESDRGRVTELTAALEQARAQVTDAAMETQVRERSTLLATLELDAERARRALEAADAEGVARRVADATRDMDRAEAEHVRLTAALHTLSGQVEMAASEGRSELYHHAVAALDQAERHLASLDRRARAARHLWHTLQSHRDAAHRAYVLPYTQALERLGKTVYGSGFGVVVDDQLTLAARTLDGTTVPFHQLSGGAKEQLGILARLAVARLVDPTQGVPVVIDDALGYSDPARLRQMGEVLGASASGADLQVILLTCTPERYAAIPEATTVRLSA